MNSFAAPFPFLLHSVAAEETETLTADHSGPGTVLSAGYQHLILLTFVSTKALLAPPPPQKGII